MADALDALAASLPDGAGLLATIEGPFRRSWRRHPHRGAPSGWGTIAALPWSPLGAWHDAGIDPATRLDYHTGCIYPQEAASQLPVALLAPRAGELVIDCCAAPGSKSTQIGLALGDSGLLICCDASRPRRRALRENLARQGVIAGLVTPMPVAELARRAPGCADAVLVDAPCSGHARRSAKQLARMAAKQQRLLATAATLVRPGGRLVYSTCTPYPAENEAVIAAFLAARPDWRSAQLTLPACDGGLADGVGSRLWPQRQGTEPFFACRLTAPGAAARADAPLVGDLPVAESPPEWSPPAAWHCWQRGGQWFAATPAAARCALPSEARGLLLGRSGRWQTWAVQALIERGRPAETVDQATALALWSGAELATPLPSACCLRTAAGAPLGQLDATGRRLQLDSRLARTCLA